MTAPSDWGFSHAVTNQGTAKGSKSLSGALGRVDMLKMMLFIVALEHRGI